MFGTTWRRDFRKLGKSNFFSPLHQAIREHWFVECHELKCVSCPDHILGCWKTATLAMTSITHLDWDWLVKSRRSGRVHSNHWVNSASRNWNIKWLVISEFWYNASSTSYNPSSFTGIREIFWIIHITGKLIKKTKRTMQSNNIWSFLLGLLNSLLCVVFFIFASKKLESFHEHQLLNPPNPQRQRQNYDWILLYRKALHMSGFLN